MKSLVLDSEAISRLARARAGKAKPDIVQLRIRSAAVLGAPVLVPAAVLAEQYRGGAHDHLVDACLSRYPGLETVNTDRKLARQIGNILSRVGLGSAHHVDATVVAVAKRHGGGVILTSDPADLKLLAGGDPMIKIVGL